VERSGRIACGWPRSVQAGANDRGSQVEVDLAQHDP